MDEKWELDIFGRYDEDEILPYRCIGVNCNYCIPFNSETEYLHGTSDDYPEKYK